MARKVWTVAMESLYLCLDQGSLYAVPASVIAFPSEIAYFSFKISGRQMLQGLPREAPHPRRQNLP